ncbi:CIA30 family protein [Pseudohalocynthiibacter aestuariivivens]|uniref:CIA30 family protein n=1 Tax=Pseudohalocynthiibacter aestuariivivens TaxID=1591409 RepID=A0ABV5JE70_9RHOB|nr:MULTISPECIES: CIA30 family protein [Pseudohalocynthiibacter]MBS9718989.1 CIA30 family protein [Pseudohalocynthiibacter aestuariivivens]MCK0104494.1 CIA30 family protein [Pseudohalocynthiibacter sp. F2068]
MQLHPHWEFVADTVMGGVSTGNVTHEIFEGREATVLRGEVSLDNNGGFIQMAFDLCQDGSSVDISAWDGIQATVWGNSHIYDFRLRTAQLARSWQSFRTDFETKSEWQTVQIPFSSFIAHRVEALFDPTRLRRIGIVAIGHEFSALVAVSSIGFYSAS